MTFSWRPGAGLNEENMVYSKKVLEENRFWRLNFPIVRNIDVIF